ncbi:condensation domain-containing protein [Ruegeria sp. Ofav3-42]|uniref:condensation domain-containing protein n=1 Tax=Ruegeria sp. Ofav3-42 TaxID=2917759 RepID=UPI001EF45A77|nr:condensation domain-containing protein [Ruegeria sp. Ofav3-42]MCG7521803.1 condensation domain-containing protein [Ruegeria sp. Ofav3-42]
MSDFTDPNRMMPLTLAQKDFWEEFTFHPDLPVSTVAHYIEMNGQMDGDALNWAIQKTCDEAETLSVRFHDVPDAPFPVQSCDPDYRPVLRQVDLRGEHNPRQEALRLMHQDMEKVIDLRSQPVSQQWLLQLGDDHWMWYNRGHHIVLDGYSMLLLEQRVAQLYLHKLGKSERGTSFRPYSDFIDEDLTYSGSTRFASDRAYWKDRLSGSERLGVLEKGGEDYGVEGLWGECPISAKTEQGLLSLAKEVGLSWPDMLVLVSGAYLLHCLPEAASDAGSDRVLPVWLPFMSRMGSVNALIPSLGVNILPFYLKTGDAGEDLNGFLRRSARELRQMRRHGRYRVEQIAADHGIGSGKRFFFSPLINVMPFEEPDIHGCDSKRVVLSNGPADGFNLTFRADSQGRGMNLRLDADPALTSQAEFDMHLRALREYMNRAVRPGNLSHPVERIVQRACETTPA